MAHPKKISQAANQIEEAAVATAAGVHRAVAVVVGAAVVAAPARCRTRLDSTSLSPPPSLKVADSGRRWQRQQLGFEGR
jgi:hypothetical protein